MSRCVFQPGDQRKFMSAVKEKFACSWEEIGNRVGLSARTLRDWRREVLLGKKETLQRFSLLTGFPLPHIIEERDEWWNAKKWQREANKIRLKIHGPPGTPAGRSKGGRNSQLRRKLYPERYAGSGIILGKTFNFPSDSVELAEFIGIMLGDGGVSKEQIKITLHRTDDQEYARYVCDMITRLFGVKASVYTYKNVNVSTICISGVELVKFLVKKGLCIGSKKRANIGLPNWVKTKREYIRASIRGLIDTDGCFFVHKYKVKNKMYEYKKIGFVSYISQLMLDVQEGLLMLGFHPKRSGVRLFLYNQREALCYLQEVGTSNPKNIARWR